MNAAVSPAVDRSAAAPQAATPPQRHRFAVTRRTASLVALALLVTLANSFKTIHIDDAAYVLYAAHIAERPLAPYDFDIYWDYHWQPANQVLAPPVLLYWLAGAMRWLGDDPALWKLSLLPLHLLLVFSLHALLRRFAALVAGPVTWMLVLSPALLPGTNLMLDVPALALGLGALAVFFRACDGNSWALALAAGALGGLAMQTKYTAFVVPGVVLVYGLMHRRRCMAMATATTALALFAAWEGLIAWQQGQSHFLAAVFQRTGSSADRIRHLVLPLLTLVPAVAPATMLLALAALARSWRWVAGAAAALGGGLLLIGIVPEQLAVFSRDAINGNPRLTLESILYGALMAAWWAVLALAARRLRVWRFGDRATLFLLVWLSLEVLSYFALSPFPAARRMLGVVVVTTLLTARLAHFAIPHLRRRLWAAAGVSAACGIALALIDLREAAAAEEAARAAAQVARNGSGSAWFSGTWGFQFHAVRERLRPLQPGQTQLKRGDRLVLAEQQLARIDFCPDDAPLAPLQTIAIEDRSPWRTVLCYYCGRIPVQHHEGPRLRVTVYRVLADFVPTSHGELPPLR